MVGIISTLIFFFLLCLIRPITVIIHELGHAIPYYLLSNGNISVYIGSYGNSEDNWDFTIGRMTIYFNRDFLSWKTGVVTSSEGVSVNRNIIITLGGPFSSLFVGILVVYFALSSDIVHGGLRLLSVSFFASSFFDFWANIKPRKNSIRLYNGKIAHNDGEQLRQLFKLKRHFKAYQAGIDAYNKQNFKNSANLLHGIIKKGVQQRYVFDYALFAYIHAEDYENALLIHEEIAKLFILQPIDYQCLATIYSKILKYDAAIEAYNEAIRLKPNDMVALNNRGYTYNLLQHYDEAIADFNQSIEIDPKFAYPYNNRGLAKIKLGQTEEGLKDIEHSQKLDNTNAYVYLNLGIYHFDEGRFEEALVNFETAKEMNNTTHLIDKYILETKEKISR